MISTSQKGLRRLRALCVSIALLVGTVAGPFWLVTQGSDLCRMTCCVKAGSCCCAAGRSDLDSAYSNQGPEVGAPISTPCGKSCTTSILSAKLTRRSHFRAASHQPIIYDRPGICWYDQPVLRGEQVVTLQKAIDSRGGPSRAPPPFQTSLSA